MFNEEEFLILDKNNCDVTKKTIRTSDGNFKVVYENNVITVSVNGNDLRFFKNPLCLLKDSILTFQPIINDINKVLKFDGFVKVFFKNGSTQLYLESNLDMAKNLLEDENAQRILDYLREMARHLNIQDSKVAHNSQNNNYDFLAKIYDNFTYISDESVLCNYFSGCKSKARKYNRSFLYPFRFNLSQRKAVENAFNNNISVIEGPPGTGKTQTILNIIVNAILNGKTVAVLSNNNSATDNIYKKLEEQGLDLLCAKLGNKKNILDFIEGQNEKKSFPDSWRISDSNMQSTLQQLSNLDNIVNYYLHQRNEIAKLESELEAILLEQEHFKLCPNFSNSNAVKLPLFHADKLNEFLIYLNKQTNKTEYFNLKVKIFSQLKFQFFNFKLYKNKIEEILETIESTFYIKKIEELRNTIGYKKNELIKYDSENYFKIYTEWSMAYFKSYVSKNYNHKNLYNINQLKNTKKFIKDYPIILSTTYSLPNCVDSDFMFDYVIIDESSQVDLVSSFPALSFAKNAIIVGDSKQLSNIVSDQKRDELDEIFQKFNVNEKYNYTKNSLLNLTMELYENMPSVVLKEHYRCHSKIIGFCNQNFYNNELIILSENNSLNPIKIYRSVKENHARKDEDGSQFNDRQAQIIMKEIIPGEHINILSDSLGIITPYKSQKKYLMDKMNCETVEIDTVYGFQGREKDVIIFSTVANDITNFLDNPNSINVAVSRAMNQLILVMPYEYKSAEDSNIANLIRYITYNNFEIENSKINSIFDILYKTNIQEREVFLSNNFISRKFLSESIMLETIMKILSMEKYQTFLVNKNAYPLRKIVKDRNIFDLDELEFIKRNSHVDFFIYNKFDKSPVLAIEVDGFFFHNSEEQKIRDKKKDSILNKCGIPLLRFKTNECQEVERIMKKLDEINEK